MMQHHENAGKRLHLESSSNNSGSPEGGGHLGHARLELGRYSLAWETSHRVTQEATRQPTSPFSHECLAETMCCWQSPFSVANPVIRGSSWRTSAPDYVFPLVPPCPPRPISYSLTEPSIECHIGEGLLTSPGISSWITGADDCFSSNWVVGGNVCYYWTSQSVLSSERGRLRPLLLLKLGLDGSTFQICQTRKSTTFWMKVWGEEENGRSSCGSVFQESRRPLQLLCLL